MSARVRVVGVAILLLGGVLGAFLLGSAPREEVSDTRNASGSGFRIHLDEDGKPAVPEPGRDLPTTESGAGGGAATEREIEIQQAPGGGEMVVLDERFDHRSALHLDSAGGVSMDCRRAAEASRIYDAGG